MPRQARGKSKIGGPREPSPWPPQHPKVPTLSVPCLIPVNSPILKIRVCKGEKGYLVFGFNYTDKDFEGNVTAPIEDKEVTLFFSVPADDVSILEIDYENRKEEL